MIIGTVIGEIWATRRAARLAGQKLLVVRPDAAYRPYPGAGHLVCLDDAEAGVGDHVLVSYGAPARTLTRGPRTPAEAIILGIVDGWSDENGSYGELRPRGNGR